MMTPMDDATATATMTAILADHERWVARYQAPDVDETGPDGARKEAGFAILEASKDENGGAVLPTPSAVAPHDWSVMMHPDCTYPQTIEATDWNFYNDVVRACVHRAREANHMFRILARSPEYLLDEDCVYFASVIGDNMDAARHAARLRDTPVQISMFGGQP